MFLLRARFFIALTAFGGAILNTYGKFAVPAFTPVLMNLCLIAAALWFAPYFEQPVLALAWGVFVAGIVQLLFQLPFLYRLNLLPIPALDGGHIMFNLYEMITRHAPSEKVLVNLTIAGWVILLGLMSLGLYNDFTRLMG